MTPVILDPTDQIGALNLQGARTELAARGYDYLPPGRMTFMLNNAKNQFEDVWEWPWLWRILTGTAPLTISDLKLVYTVKHAGNDGNELLGLDARQIAQGGDQLEQPGTPQYWWLENTSVLRVWPYAPVSLEVVYLAESRDLVNDTDEPLIPPRYRPLWIDYAVVEALKDSDNYQGAQALRADINTRMTDLIARYEVRNRQHSIITSQRVFHEDD